MFEIKDGRESFYQWDIDRQLIVNDAITQVHFCNRTDDCSLVVEVVDGVANVPNVLLQQSWPIKVYGYDENYTKYCKTFKVLARSKPADYVYTETEILSYETLLKRVEDIDSNIEGAVESWLEENPIEMDGYATEEYVEMAVDNAIDLLEMDNYYTKTEVDDAVKNVKVDLTGYATEDYVDKAVDNIEIPEVDLTGYATEKYVDDAIADIELTGGGGVGAAGTGEGAEIFNDYKINEASGKYSHAEGDQTKAIGTASHAEGRLSTASGNYSHTEGHHTTASGNYSHAEGDFTTASSGAAHAEGYHTTASGYYSHAEGHYTTAAGKSQHVQGAYNIEDTENKYLHIVGNGKQYLMSGDGYNAGDVVYSNAHTIDWDGNAWFKGNVYIGGTSMDDAVMLGAGGGNVDLTNYATKSYVEETVNEMLGVIENGTY